MTTKQEADAAMDFIMENAEHPELWAAQVRKIREYVRQLETEVRRLQRPARVEIPEKRPETD